VLAALACFTQTDCPEREQAIAEFYQRWQHDTLVLDKWFSLQAMSHLPGTLAAVEKLMEHPIPTKCDPSSVPSVSATRCVSTMPGVPAIVFWPIG